MTSPQPVGRRAVAELDAEQRSLLVASYRIAYHHALSLLLERVQALVAAAGHAARAHEQLGEADDAPLSLEERSVFTTAQGLISDAVARYPGVSLLFPPPPGWVPAEAPDTAYDPSDDCGGECCRGGDATGDDGHEE
jgi:hypothetical protein